MNLAQRAIYFIIGLFIGTIVVVFIAQKKGVKFPYGPDARTLKSIRVKKYQKFSDNALLTAQQNNLDSIRIAYILSEGDVDFSKSMTDTKKPCQTYWIDASLKEQEVTLIVERCDSTATIQDIKVTKIK